MKNAWIKQIGKAFNFSSQTNRYRNLSVRGLYAGLDACSFFENKSADIKQTFKKHVTKYVSKEIMSPREYAQAIHKASTDSLKDLGYASDKIAVEAQKWSSEIFHSVLAVQRHMSSPMNAKVAQNYFLSSLNLAK